MRKLLRASSYAPGTRYRYSGLEFSYGKLFTRVTEISVAKNRANPPLHVHTSKFNEEKTGDARSRKPSQPNRLGSGSSCEEELEKSEECMTWEVRDKVSAAKKATKCHTSNQPTFLSFLISCFLCFFSSFVSSLFLVVLRGTCVWLSSASISSLALTVLVESPWENTPTGIPALDNLIGLTLKREKKRLL